MKKNIKQYLLGFIAAVIVGFGVAILTEAGFGLDAFNSLIGNFVLLTGRSFGLFSLLFGILFVTFNTIINRKKFNFIPIGISFIIGISIDIFMPLVLGTLGELSVLFRVIWFVVGLFIYGFGIALLISTNILSPLEEYMMAIKKIFNTTVAKSKFISDITLILFAVLVGLLGLGSFGQIGVGTLIITVLMGKIIDLFLKFLKMLEIKQNIRCKILPIK